MEDTLKIQQECAFRNVPMDLMEMLPQDIALDTALKVGIHTQWQICASDNVRLHFTQIQPHKDAFKYVLYLNSCSANHLDALAQPFVPNQRMQHLIPKLVFHNVRLNHKAALHMTLLASMILINVWMNVQSHSTVGLWHMFAFLFVLILTMKILLITDVISAQMNVLHAIILKCVWHATKNTFCMPELVFKHAQHSLWLLTQTLTDNVEPVTNALQGTLLWIPRNHASTFALKVIIKTTWNKHVTPAREVVTLVPTLLTA